ncbi:MAG: hypothetical protein ACREPD_03535 [Stenotrophomonas sp.]|uniref:hypothetical protein n=1 Tax=Stenotrophomonas sp. TaxID=69392 RepID=UPI003D6CF4CB
MGTEETTIHVFVGAFADLDAALLYSEEQWLPEPDDSASEAEYSAWEDSNPSWAMEDELGFYLDSDFIETIGGETRFDYLATQISDQSAVDRIRQAYATTTSVLVLIWSDALDGLSVEMKSTSKLIYCGTYPRRQTSHATLGAI